MFIKFDVNDYEAIKKYLLNATDEELQSKNLSAAEIRQRINTEPKTTKERCTYNSFLRDKLMTVVSMRNDRYLLLSKVTKISYFEGDLETSRTVFSIPEDLTKDEILENRRFYVALAMKEVITKTNIDKRYLEVTEFIWRKNFKEIMVTIRLKKEILDLKEKWSEVEAV